MYSKDLRVRVVAYYRAQADAGVGVSYASVARVFRVSPTTVRRWVGGFEPQGCRRKKIDAARADVEALLETDPDMTYARMQVVVAERTGVRLSIGSLLTLRKELGFTRKRVVARKVWGSIERVSQKRAAFRDELSEAVFSSAVSMDECHFTMWDAPRYGYARAGRRILQHVPCRSNKSFSLLLAMSKTGEIAYDLLEGAINTERFVSFLSRLRLLGEGGRAVLMDNVAFHRSRRVKELLEQRRSQAVYTPPYTPEYNPVELCFAQIKQHVRAIASRRPLTEGDIHAAITRVTPENCRNYFDVVWEDIKGQRPSHPELRGQVRAYALAAR